MANYMGNRWKRCWLKEFLTRTGAPTESGCREWRGHCSPYGVIHYQGKYRLTHRLSYALKEGLPLDFSGIILHQCDNPKCVAWGHLSLGTYKDNTQDMVRKGRNKHITGERHPLAKIPDAQYPVIRGLVSSGRSMRSVAAEYRVNKNVIRRICSG